MWSTSACVKMGHNVGEQNRVKMSRMVESCLPDSRQPSINKRIPVMAAEDGNTLAACRNATDMVVSIWLHRFSSLLYFPYSILRWLPEITCIYYTGTLDIFQRFAGETVSRNLKNQSKKKKGWSCPVSGSSIPFAWKSSI